MHFRRILAAWCLSACALVLPTFAQSVKQFCEPAPSVRQTLQRLAADLAALPRAAKQERELAALQVLLKDQPGDVFVHRRYQEAFLAVRENDPLQLLEEYRQRTEAQPNDAAAHYLYAAALKGWRTPEAIAQAERALRLSPALARAEQLLAELYQLPAFRDKAKSLAHAKAFLNKCPGSFSAYEVLKQLDDPAELRATATKLRALLEASAEEEAVGLYPTLWQAEFKVRPVAEHADARKLVEQDLARLRGLKLETSELWFVTMRDGYKQISDKAGEAWVGEQMIVHHPNSMRAFSFFKERWEQEQPRPAATEPKEKHQAYGELRYQTAVAWAKRWPENFSARMEQYVASQYVSHWPRDVFYAAYDEAFDKYVEAAAHNPGLMGGQPLELVVALQYVQRGRRLDTALNLIERALAEMTMRDRREQLTDRFPPEQKARFYGLKDAQWLGVQLQFEAYLKLKQLDKAREALATQANLLPKLKPPENSDTQPQARYADSQANYWDHAGMLAEAENRKPDALLFYENARLLRPQREGQKTDYFTAKQRRLWQELGGTEEGWQAWLNRGAPSKTLLSLSSTAVWEKLNKPLPNFTFTDLQGKKWQLADLKGKVAFISAWASW